MYSIWTAEEATYHPGLVIVELRHAAAQGQARGERDRNQMTGVYEGISLTLDVSAGPLCLPGRLVLTELSIDSRISGRLFLSLSWSVTHVWLSLSNKINEGLHSKIQHVDTYSINVNCFEDLSFILSSPQEYSAHMVS